MFNLENQYTLGKKKGMLSLMEQGKKRQIVKSIQLANYLLQEGFHIEEIKQNKYSDGELVFFFTNSPELQFYMSKYMNRLNVKK